MLGALTVAVGLWVVSLGAILFTWLEDIVEKLPALCRQTDKPVYALLTDPEGVVFPLLHQLGVVPRQLRDHVDELLENLWPGTVVTESALTQVVDEGEKLDLGVESEEDRRHVDVGDAPEPYHRRSSL